MPSRRLFVSENTLWLLDKLHIVSKFRSEDDRTVFVARVNENRTNVLLTQIVHFVRCPSGAALLRILAQPLF